MYRVMDAIELKDSWTFRMPELAGRGEGILAILDPTEISVAPAISGQTVTVRRPDGTVAQLTAAEVEAPHSVVGLFFKGAVPADIPRGSFLEW
jgi:hypothetical protein